MTCETPKPVIVNLVATASLNQPVDLLTVSEINDTIFDPEIYGGRVAYLKTLDMHGKVSIFPSGKLISIGTKSLAEAEEDLQKTNNILVEHDLIKHTQIKATIRNIVAVITLDEMLNLEEIATKCNAIYEPEQFPAVIYKLSYPKATLLLFASGKVVIAGVKNLKELKEISNTLINII